MDKEQIHEFTQIFLDIVDDPYFRSQLIQNGRILGYINNWIIESVLSIEDDPEYDLNDGGWSYIRGIGFCDVRIGYHETLRQIVYALSNFKEDYKQWLSKGLEPELIGHEFCDYCCNLESGLVYNLNGYADCSSVMSGFVYSGNLNAEEYSHISSRHNGPIRTPHVQ